MPIKEENIEVLEAGHFLSHILRSWGLPHFIMYYDVNKHDSAIYSQKVKIDGLPTNKLRFWQKVHSIALKNILHLETNASPKMLLL